MEENQINESTALERGELEQPPDDHPMNALMEEALSFQILKRGDTDNGTIVSETPTEVLVDVKAKSEGVEPSKELERLGREGLESLTVGDTILVYVVRPEDRDGNLILSLRRAEEEGDWQEAQTRFEAGDWFESQVAGFNKGGLIVRLGKLRGFVPASQLSPQHQGSNKQQPEERWARLVGTQINVKIIEINRKRRRLILSERAALRQWRDAQKEKLLDDLRVGEVRHGTVSSLSDFGAFVDLGGADGLVHISELSWNRSAQPRDVLRAGQEVDVYVLNVDRDKKRIALSLKRLEPEPWTTVESRYYVGQLVEGTITRLANFGAFALVNDEIEGLIHISELSTGRIDHPREIVQEREKHVMRIIRIDPRRRRMGLSLKRVADPAYADLDWRAELAEAEEEIAEIIEVSDSLEGEEPATEPVEAEADLEEGTAEIIEVSDSLEGEEPATEPVEAEADLEEGTAEIIEVSDSLEGEELATEPAEADAVLEEETAEIIEVSDSLEGEEPATEPVEAEADLEEETAEIIEVSDSLEGEELATEPVEADAISVEEEIVEPVKEPEAAASDEDDPEQVAEAEGPAGEEEVSETAGEPDADEEVSEAAGEPEEPAADEPFAGEEDAGLAKDPEEPPADKDLLEPSGEPEEPNDEVEIVELVEKAGTPVDTEGVLEPAAESELTVDEGEAPETVVEEPFPSEEDEETEST